MIIDTHCHIDLYPNPRKVLQDCVKADITVLAMTNLPSYFEMGYVHFQSLKKIRLALGMHPLMANSHKKEFNLFLKNLNKTSYIGEVGLDFSQEGISTKEIQIDTFTKILNVISGQKKILSIHSRRAEKEVLIHLMENKIQFAIFHWYSGPLNLIDKIVQAGFYFSINPAMIKSENGKKIISKIPLDRVLTESDGPFIEVEKRTIFPSDVTLVLLYFAKIHMMTPLEVERKIYSNFKNLLLGVK